MTASSTRAGAAIAAARRSEAANDSAPAATSAAAFAPVSGFGHRPRSDRLRNPLAALAAARCARLLDRVAAGTIRVGLPDGRVIEAQGRRPGPQAELRLHRWRVLARLALSGDIGLAEAYRDGDWSSPDLVALLEFGARNEDAFGAAVAAAGPWRMLFRLAHALRRNSRRGSRDNIAFHYDLGNAFYAAWLDRDLMYSSAIDADPMRSLEEAQRSRIERIAGLLDLDRLGADASVLEIGCGWGALAREIATRFRGRVSGITLSTEQLAHARRVADSSACADRIDLRLLDYRDTRGRFDRIVSIEMIEAVGEAYWPVYFETIAGRLKPGGRAVLQAITIAEDRFERYRANPDFIQHFIFPGGMLPTRAAIERECARAGLEVVESQAFGAGYARTLADWRARFAEAGPRIAALGFDDRFRRLWDYYLAYCEAGFRCGRVDVGLYVIEASPPAGSS